MEDCQPSKSSFEIKINNPMIGLPSGHSSGKDNVGNEHGDTYTQQRVGGEEIMTGEFNGVHTKYTWWGYWGTHKIYMVKLLGYRQKIYGEARVLEYTQNIKNEVTGVHKKYLVRLLGYILKIWGEATEVYTKKIQGEATRIHTKTYKVEDTEVLKKQFKFSGVKI